MYNRRYRWGFWRGHRAVFAVLLAALSGCGEPPPTRPSRAELLAVVSEALQAESPALRAETLRLTVYSDAPELLLLLEAGAADAEQTVRDSALYARMQRGALDAVEREVFERLATGTDEGRRTALELVLRRGPADLRSRVGERALRHSNAGFRGFSFRRLLLAGRDRLALPSNALARALDGDDPMVAADALDWVEGDGVRGPRHRVHAALVSDDLDERLFALRILAVSPSRDAWPYLRWAQTRGEPREQALAAIALARLGEPDVGDALEEVLRAGEAELVPFALRALAGQPSERSLEHLLAFRESAHRDVRLATFRTLVALGAGPQALLPFIDDNAVEIASAAIERLATAPIEALETTVCPDLQLLSDPLPLLRLLFRLLNDSESIGLARACEAQLQQLLHAEQPDVRALAARLHYALHPVTPDTAPPADASHEVLYAFVDASLSGDRAAHQDRYRDLLEHELWAIRVAAAIGLLDSTLQ